MSSVNVCILFTLLDKDSDVQVQQTWNGRSKIIVNSTTLEQVSHYKYLGSWITEDGRTDMDSNQE